MSKYTSRINKLVVKTHDFISHHDLCISRDYFKDRFDGCEKSEDFEREFKESEEFARKAINGSYEHLAKFTEILKTNEAIRYRTLYKIAVEECDEFLRGIWMAKPTSEHYLKIIRDAKRYFKEKKSQE
jgi:hypothetical protein